MVTVRQIEKLWNARNYGRLVCEMLAGRPEASLRLEGELGAASNPARAPESDHRETDSPRPSPESFQTSACATVLLRLDELSQSHVSLYSRLLKVIISRQESDGGWGDPLTTALCLRALMAGRGHGVVIDRGLQYLANLQKPEGIWPKVPVRRLAGDAYTSAFILLQLGADERFRRIVRVEDAVRWFNENILTLDPETRRLWDHASLRCRNARTHESPQGVLSWS